MATHRPRPPARRTPPAPTRSPRHSIAVPLVLLGAFGVLTWRGSGTDVQRNRYENLQDCVADYSQNQCQPDTPVHMHGGGGVHYYGPWYRSRAASQGVDGDPGPGRSGGSSTARLYGSRGPSGIELGTRGGFGGHGRVAARAS